MLEQMLRRSFTLFTCGLSLVLAAASASSGAGPAVDSGALLRKFEPVLLFHAQEDWAPERADAFVGRVRVEKQIARGSWAAVPPPLPTDTSGCAFTPCYRFNLGCALKAGDGCYEASRAAISDWNQPVVYGRVLSVPAGNPAPPGVTSPPRYLVRYWLFYEFDDWRSPHRRLWQAHEGDWENITIGLSATLQPQFAAYSEHCSGTIRAWASVAKRGNTHPVDYVALGSHANYFSNNTNSTKFSECLRRYLDRPELARATNIVKLAEDRLVDRMGTAHPSGPGGLAGTTPLELVELARPLPPWASFPGRWSEGQLLWLGQTPHRLTSIMESGGPATPNWNSTSIPSYWHSTSS
jgi:hypothetical protein